MKFLKIRSKEYNGVTKTYFHVVNIDKIAIEFIWHTYSGEQINKEELKVIMTQISKYL